MKKEKKKLWLVGLHRVFQGQIKVIFFTFENQLEAQWAEPVSLIFYSALRKLNT